MTDKHIPKLEECYAALNKETGEVGLYYINPHNPRGYTLITAFPTEKPEVGVEEVRKHFEDKYKEKYTIPGYTEKTIKGFFKWLGNGFTEKDDLPFYVVMTCWLTMGVFYLILSLLHLIWGLL